MRRVISNLVRISAFSVRPVGARPPKHKFLQLCSLQSLQARAMSEERKIDLSYDDIIDLKAKDQIVLVDVREPKEIQETGKLPGSIHIPLGELQQALQLPSEEFKSKYEGADQPDKTSDLVFSCRGGVRSRKAMAAAQEIGFANVRHYAGGWLDWEAKTKK
ncbi:thiosulfate sulfurtransferase/rhodanese-like domain-containing protein 3 [Neocloeon triangulifer]|uniref:thiosulfate sulfurtransferase/rhodanese-like domain-containing protein 3 n=1 Tax=Neocloeon triangulifer TaxID=2078957 RepID=UPI00286F83CA|nr:thiosulfate sulfurtransferase/rhodanese-like domain-containing protein 3 [Neocloeon triangulifer]